MTPKSLRAEELAPSDGGDDAETAPPGRSGPAPGPRDGTEAPSRERPAGSPRFFHPPDSFGALRTHVFPALLRGRQAADVLRVWVLGCSTGEKVYSLAIALSERLEAERRYLQLIIYGTDLDGAAIERARRGCYPRSIEADIEPERLRHCFVEAEGGYRISPALRSRCVFACHNPLADPPLSQMDLVDCRDLLTHLEPALQEHLQRLLDYALKPGGFLLLGPSDTAPLARRQLVLVDARHQLYKKPPPDRPAEPVKELDRAREEDPAQPAMSARPYAPGLPPPRLDPQELAHEVERVLLDHYAPPGVLINAAGDVLQVHGETAPFLRPGPGHHRLSLFELAPEELRAVLRASLSRARQGAGAGPEAAQIRVGERAAWLRILPVHGPAASAPRYWVLFEPLRDPGGDGEAAQADAARLQQELTAMRGYLESVLLQQEAASEELQGVSEEVRSAQDELGILQDALVAAQQELQQSQGQLSALSGELSRRERDLVRLHDDVGNLLSEVPLPVVLLGSDLRVRRFTPLAAQLLPLGPTDGGRSLRELAAGAEPWTEPTEAADRRDLADLADLAEQVLRSARPDEREVTARGGRRYLARASPYRTQDRRIDGVVLVFVPR